MDLPVMPPVKPMLARSVAAIPEGMFYEPKFDGFRCIVFRDGDEIELSSRNARSLTRYFPDVIGALLKKLPPRCVFDGEVVVVRDHGLDFEALQQRIHPAASRISLLAEETPASYIAFDLLALGDVSYLDKPFTERRTTLQSVLQPAAPAVFIAPLTSSMELAAEWFQSFEGAGLDGIIAKPADLPYVQDQRRMFKIKHERTAECVVGGFRRHKSGEGVGSLLLGLYDDNATLHHVGVAASFTVGRRRELLEKLAPYRLDPSEGHPWAPAGGFELSPGGEPSRWNRDKDMSWEPLAPSLVAEVGYDYMEGMRFRHVTHFKRWRPDRHPRSCTFAQLERPIAVDLERILGAKSWG